MDIGKIYGLKPMTFEEEANAPDTIKSIRSSKMVISIQCESIKSFADQIEDRAKGIVEKDDKAYVELIDQFERLVREAEYVLHKATMLGRE